MLVNAKTTLKYFVISLMAAAAVFISTLFLNYNIDITNISGEIPAGPAFTYYEAQKLTSLVVCCASGGCILITTIIMLAFFIKNYIDAHKKELGIMKALGYSNWEISKNFWVFGLNILLGSAIGFLGAFAIMEKFYEAQNESDLLPNFSFNFHPILLLALVILPALLFSLFSVYYASRKLRVPALDLIRDTIITPKKSKRQKHARDERPFLSNVKRATLKSRKSLIFFMFFGAFCFSAMTQMSFGTRDMASPLLSYMLLVLGLIVAFVSLFLATSTIVKNSSKTTAVMKVFGYSDRSCEKAVLGGYHPFALLGFAVGTFYQYFLLKFSVSLIFRDMEVVPEYNFNLGAMFLSLALFIVTYEIFMLFGLRRIKNTPIKEIMLES